MADDAYDEDIFDDLYDEEPASKPAPAAPAVKAEAESAHAEPVPEPSADTVSHVANIAPPAHEESYGNDADAHMDNGAWNGDGGQSHGDMQTEDDNYGPINVKEDG